MRLIFKLGKVFRKIASINISKHDGSINLALVRSGFNTSGWKWNSSLSIFEAVQYAEPQEKTKKITIHTSGRINYHMQRSPSVNFIPCLLDLTEAVTVVSYYIPTITILDTADSTRIDDYIFELAEISTESCIIEFYAVSLKSPQLPGEAWRGIIENSYGLACVIIFGDSYPLLANLPLNAFTVMMPSTLLPQQAIPEDLAFIRFQKLMYENQVRKDLASSTIPVNEHDKLAEKIISCGRGIQGPNNDGVWEIVCSVPMRIQPKLDVQFSDSRYRAEIKYMERIDNRLEKVRVRFKVYDQQVGNWVKHSVEITSATLDAEL